MSKLQRVLDIWETAIAWTCVAVVLGYSLAAVVTLAFHFIRQ